MAKNDAQYIRMTETPVGKLITSLAIPTIISMLVTSIYNMADTYFVSKLGESASGAVGIVFSLMAIIQAVGFTLGMGAGSWISRLLGEHKDKLASNVAASGFYAALLFGALISAAGFIFTNPLMNLLGATETILPFARDYARLILTASPIMAASFVMNNILRAEGKARFAMVGLTSGGILNMLLDPLFIFVFKMGIKGAAAATSISQLVSFVILLICFLQKKTITSISPKNISKNITIYLQIIKNGLPSFSRQGLASIATVALNKNAAVYGDPAVAAMSIVGKIAMFIFSVSIGIGQGYQPVVGYNYGAEKYERVKKAFFFTFKVGFALMSSVAVIGFFFAGSIMRAFIGENAAVVEIGTAALRAQCATMPLAMIIVMSNMTFQSIGKSWTATFLSCLRQGIYFLPLIIILPKLLGITGVEITQPIADVCSFITCIPFLIKFFAKLKYREENKLGDSKNG